VLQHAEKRLPPGGIVQELGELHGGAAGNAAEAEGPVPHAIQRASGDRRNDGA